ncbi:hypothetical protein KTH_11220 [Thermosporothrix hazakensis]|jgi:hypothetical protein|nr:hypothetical protein KTH_11220 [Thermosporothrix hazakensis]
MDNTTDTVKNTFVEWVSVLAPFSLATSLAISNGYQKAAEGPWLQPGGWMAQEASRVRTFPFA